MFASEKFNITILVAPLDWGLGHATRCIPIITYLLQLGCKVIIATEGAQEKLLKTEFPTVDFVKLPGYRIKYSNSKRFFSLKIILQLPKIWRSIRSENKWLKKFTSSHAVDAITSDNRYGFQTPGVPCIFITHQLNILTPFISTGRLLQKVSYHFIEKFTSCWVPDEQGEINLAGTLSHPNRLPRIPVTYLGGLSRLNMQVTADMKYDLLIIISGPEPQRSVLEKIMQSELRSYNGTTLFLRGLPQTVDPVSFGERVTVKHHLPADALAVAIGNSNLVISRSGYTTVLDIMKLRKKSILIPTPGQTEQEYLAKHLEEQGWCATADQDNFNLNDALLRSQQCEYKLPLLNMESYKTVVEDFVKNLKSH